MAVFGSALERAERHHAADQARVASIRSDIVARETKPREGVSFEALVAADEEVIALRRKLTIAEGVAADSSARLDAVRAEARADEAKRDHGEMERKVPQAIKRLKRIAELSSALRDELSLHSDHVAEFEKYNRENRGRFAFIPDAECRLLEIPSKTEPAQFEVQEKWNDGQGNEPMTFRRNREGQMVPQELGFSLRKVRVQVRSERFIPANMPPRLTGGFKLVDLQGTTIWPR